MNRQFRLKSLALAVSLAFPLYLMATPAHAASPYPALPPTLSTSVTPNIMLYLDTSGSMLQDESNSWMLTNLCNSNVNWSACVNNNTNNYRTKIDSETDSPNTKMNIAKRVARNLVDKNSSLRFGLFSFQDQLTSVGGDERGQAGVLRADIRDMSKANKDTLFTAIGNLHGRTATPLGEGLLELTRYFEGKSSLYSKIAGSYTSPIQYRCQKNFAIIVTDGDATNEDDLPGSNGKAALAYTARDSSGGAVAKTFSVCTSANTAAADTLSVNCPASLEGSTATPGFGDTSNRFRALRDVSKYAQVADLRVGGTDLDGKSFDDPKFARQNLSIYTIGFTVANDVLPAAASVGGGKYYTAHGESALYSALSSAVNDILANTSNAGGLATQSEVTSAGNVLLQPVFNPSGWYGELRCFNFTSTGTIGSACSPNAKAVIPAASSRKIYSSSVTGSTTTVFDFNTSSVNSMTSYQRASLGSSVSARENVINWLRGTSIAGMRARSNGLLGDIIDGQPTVVAASSGVSNDPDYAAFKSSNANRKLAFVGANDGMLHAFDISTMTEIMAYVPSPVYPNLAALTSTDYGVSSGTPHVFHVNGMTRKADVKTTAGWKTMLVGGLGQGGQGFYALDATSSGTLTSSASSAVKWELTDVSDAEMGYTFGTPLIYNVRTSATTVVPVAILTNGYDNDYDDTANGGQKKTPATSALYIVNVLTGQLLKKISVTGGAGLSSPAGADYGQDGILDYVYAGDMNGKVWRFDLTSASPDGFFVSPNPVFDAGSTHPITMRPAVMPINEKITGQSKGNLIFFGTGKIITDADRTDTTTQSFYAVLDNVESAASTVSKSSLLQQSVVDTQVVSGSTTLTSGTYRKLSENALDLTSATETRKGWYIDFPVSTERLVTSPLLFTERLVFGTGITQSNEKCLPGGKGWIMGVNPLTGSIVKTTQGQYFSFVDVDGDNKTSSTDKIPFSSGSQYTSGYQTDGIPTEITYIAKAITLNTVSNTTSTLGDIGNSVAFTDSNSMAVYNSNAKAGTTAGNPVSGDTPSGTGKYCYGLLGSDATNCREAPATTIGVKIESTIWREIK